MAFSGGGAVTGDHPSTGGYLCACISVVERETSKDECRVREEREEREEGGVVVVWVWV